VQIEVIAHLLDETHIRQAVNIYPEYTLPLLPLRAIDLLLVKVGDIVAQRIDGSGYILAVSGVNEASGRQALFSFFMTVFFFLAHIKAPQKLKTGDCPLKSRYYF